MAKLLIDNGADVNSQKYNEETALHEAARKGTTQTNYNNNSSNEY